MANFLDEKGKFSFDFDDLEGFDSFCADIIREYEVQLASSGKVSSRDSRAANDWLRRTAYQLISELVDHDNKEVFDQRIAKYGRRQRGQRGNPNDFQNGLMALVAHTQKLVLGPSKRELWGRQMMFAYCHHVPPAFLSAFIMKHWAGHRVGRYGRFVILPEFYNWVVKCEAEGEGRDCHYPKLIKDGVEKYNEKEERKESSRDEDWDDCCWGDEEE